MKSMIVRSILAGCMALTAADAMAKKHRWGSPKNVVIMVPDGCDETIQTVARWYKGADLEVDGMKQGTVKVHMANSIIPGSAAAATAFATGHKTTVRFLGIGPRTEDLLTGFEPTAAPYAPVASVLEAAKRKGKSVGIVVTCRVTHATPAAFGCHIMEDRGYGQPDHGTHGVQQRRRRIRRRGPAPHPGR
jgi:alkaline phosphatase